MIRDLLLCVLEQHMLSARAYTLFFKFFDIAKATRVVASWFDEGGEDKGVL
jgi:hypothetical protein